MNEVISPNNIVVIFLTYEEICNYIEEIPKFTTKNGLEHTKKLLSYLGNPHKQFEVIHVAGSNGKGSVCSALSHVLVKNGCKTGLFTSPHLVCMEERFRINEINCTKEQFRECFLLVRDAVKRMQEEGDAHPSFFEYLFAMGMVYFAKEKVSIAVIETGLGGRLDATNVIENPIFTVITSISLEHTKYLGDTIEKIALEKAGIIKHGVPVLCDASDPVAAETIQKQAQQMEAPFFQITKEQLKILENTKKSIDFSFRYGYDDVILLKIPFVAEYQVMNMALAYQTLSMLSEHFHLTKEKIKEELSDVRWQGRMQMVEDGVYFDGAHNTGGILEFLKTVEQIGGKKPILLFSMVEDKDYAKVIRQLSVRDWGMIVVTHIPDTRGLATEVLLEEFLKNGKEVLGINDIDAAYNYVMRKKEENQQVFCTGSLYLIGELEKIAGGVSND